MPRRFASPLLLSRFEEEIERLFREALELAGPGPSEASRQPRLDIVEDETAVELVFEVPGITREDLEVEVQGQEITLRGTRRLRRTDPEGSRFLCVERKHGTFERRVKLFWPVNSHRGRARLTDGLLILRFPKIEERRQRSRKLDIAEIPPNREDDRAEPDREASAREQVGREQLGREQLGREQLDRKELDREEPGT